MARASPCDMRNCAASAPQATRNAESRMLGKVQRAERADPAEAPAPSMSRSSFSARTCAEDRGTHGPRPDEVVLAPQLPRIPHPAQCGADSVRTTDHGNADSARRGSEPGGPPAYAAPGHRVAEEPHPRVREESRGRALRRALPGGK